MIIVSTPGEQSIPAFPIEHNKFTRLVEKQCKKIGEFTTVAGKIVKYYIYKDNIAVFGVIDNNIILTLSLQTIINSAVKKVVQSALNLIPVQIFRTVIDSDYKRQGITSKAYEAVVNDGTLCLLSSVYQTTPISLMWKKLASNSITPTCTVNALNLVGMFKDELSNIINYDGSNIADTLLWSTLPNRDKEDIYLVLSKTQIVLEPTNEVG